MKYLDGIEIAIDDFVEYDCQRGRVIGIRRENVVEISEVPGDLKWLKEVTNGIMILFDNGALLHVDDTIDVHLKKINEPTGQP